MFKKICTKIFYYNAFINIQVVVTTHSLAAHCINTFFDNDKAPNNSQYRPCK
jgi:hypothetical protein